MRRISIIYGSVLVVVLGIAVAALVLFHGSGKSPVTPSVSVGPSGEPVVNGFAFDVRQVKAVPTGPSKGAQAKAVAAARGIEKTMNTLYYTAYLDRNSWQGGNYANAWKLFAADTVSQAKKDERTLTLGPDAGSKLSGVAIGPNAALVKVLLDTHGQPATAVVTVHFTAKKTGTDGSHSAVTSQGDYFLMPISGGWRITGYDVKQGAA